MPTSAHAIDRPVRRVLVTGSRGYIGSVLCPMLVEAGYDVVGLDAAWYDPADFVAQTRQVPTINADVRDVERTDLVGIDAIVHLAALSNDPLGDLDPDLTFEINHRATVRLAELGLATGVGRFVFSSSCSVYGAAGDAPVDERDDLHPQTPYAESKVRAERDLAELPADKIAVTCLRNATAYGISPSQRFDVVVPNLTGLAWTTGEIRLLSDGTPWRPLVHIRDIAAAMCRCLAVPAGQAAGAVLNVGRNDENYRVREIAEAVQHAFPGCDVTLGDQSPPDRRSYRVNFDKLGPALDGFEPHWTLPAGAREAALAFADRDPALFSDPRFTRLATLQAALERGDLDATLRRHSRSAASA